MRILTVVDHLGPGGTQRVAQNYAVGYARAGFASAVLGHEGSGPRAEILRERGVEVFVDETPRAAPDALDRAVAWAPDVIHVHREGDAHPVVGGVLRCLRAALPHASMVETNVFSRADVTDTGRMFDLHFHLSRWCLWKWQKWTRFVRPRPVGIVLPYLIDAEAFYPDPEAGAAFRADLGVPDDAVLFGRIGQAMEAKWMPLLFDAFAAVAERDPRSHLLVVGLPEELRRGALARLPEAIRRRVHDVTFLKGDAALRAAYSAIDVFAHAAHKGESFGMVLVESMLCETPVVALSRPAHDNSQIEVVGHDVGGLLAADPEAFEKALDALGADPERRRRLGRSAAQRVRDRYAGERVLPDLVRAVEAVRASSSSDGLRERLRAMGFTTTVSDRDIRALLAPILGRTPVKQRLLSALVHQPHVYRLWRWVRR